jgi:hypothetical protein
MSPILMIIIGLLAGLGFGLLVAFGVVGLLIAGIGCAILVIGVIAPTPFRGLFSMVAIGFLASFILAGGLELI